MSRQVFECLMVFAGRLVLVSVLLGLAPIEAQDQTDRIVTQGEARTAEGKQAQDTIDKLAEDSDDLVAEYRTLTKIVDGLRVYNELLAKQVASQQREIDATREAIASVALIERQILPLMIRMIDALAEFVERDVPFLVAERSTRVTTLQAMMERADITVAEKFRRVIEAYEVENEYGRTIEAYRGSLAIEGAEREVDFLRIGRIALLYQTVGGERTGVWRAATGQWQELPPETYRSQVAMGLRMARQQTAPELLVLPVPAAGVP